MTVGSVSVLPTTVSNKCLQISNSYPWQFKKLNIVQEKKYKLKSRTWNITSLSLSIAIYCCVGLIVTIIIVSYCSIDNFLSLNFHSNKKYISGNELWTTIVTHFIQWQKFLTFWWKTCRKFSVSPVSHVRLECSLSESFMRISSATRKKK